MDSSDDRRDSTGHTRDGERRPHTAPGAGDAGPAPDGQGQALELRNPPEMLSYVGVRLGWHQRTALVNNELERRLTCADLDSSQWHLVRNVLVGSVVVVPIVLFGPTGVFMLQGSRGFWLDEDIALMNQAAHTFGAVMLGDYPDPVRHGIVILDGEDQERQHFTGAGEGPCWVVNDRRLIGWLSRYQDRGLSEGDIACLRAEADPTRFREPSRNLTPRGTGHDGASAEDFFYPG